ncbi:MAG TPA: (2Fe-2S)-binding protein [Candidatus Binatia bacterium]
MPQKQTIRLKVNGRERAAEVEPRRTLADLLREDFNLTGTHLGCEHGVCGACTVVLDGQAVRSCLMFAVQAEGAEVLTVEGLAEGETLHPIQQAFAEQHGAQCGFCTPGFLMSVHALLRETPRPTDAEIRVALSDNLCRCTGYHNIIAAVKAAVEKLSAAGRK